MGGWAGRRHVFVISSCSDLSSACWRSSSRSFFHLSSFCSSFCCSCSASQTFSTFLRLVVCHDFLERKESDLRQGAASGHRERAVRMNARTRAAGAAGRASRHRAVCLRGVTRVTSRSTNTVYVVSVHILVGVVISIVKQPQVARAHWAQQHRRRIVADTHPVRWRMGG